MLAFMFGQQNPTRLSLMDLILVKQIGLNELEPSKLLSWARKVDMYKLNSKVFNVQINHDHN